MLRILNTVLGLTVVASAAHGDPSEVVDVRMTEGSNGWRFDVTLAHPDTGWDHYADGWRIELEDGTVIGERPLAHPHVNEQPFTRSTSGVVIPDGTTEVFIRARDNVNGWDEGRFAVALD